MKYIKTFENFDSELDPYGEEVWVNSTDNIANVIENLNVDFNRDFLINEFYFDIIEIIEATRIIVDWRPKRYEFQIEIYEWDENDFYRLGKDEDPTEGRRIDKYLTVDRENAYDHGILEDYENIVLKLASSQKYEDYLEYDEDKSEGETLTFRII